MQILAQHKLFKIVKLMLQMKILVKFVKLVIHSIIINALQQFKIAKLKYLIHAPYVNKSF